MKIGVVNAWGNNRGDEAMISSLLCYLNSLDRNIKVTVYTDKWLDLDRHNNVHIQSWIAYKNAFEKTPNKLKKILLISSFIRPQIIRPLLRNIFEHDFIISSPAGPYLGSLYPKTELQCLSQLAICRSKEIPFGILATSAGPFLGKSQNFLRRNIFKDAQFWTVRENISKHNLAVLKNGIEEYVGGDLVFAHPYRDINEILSSGELQEFSHYTKLLEEKPFIIVTLNKTHFIRSDGTKVNFDAPSYIQKMGSFLRHVIDTSNSQILIFPHFYGDAEEQKLIKEIRKFSERESDIKILNPFYNSEVQMYLYKKAEFAISHRYHPTIFAAKAQCPFMCIRHQYKVDGMLEMFDNPGPMVNTLDSEEEWIKAFDEAWEKRSEIKKQISHFLPKVVNSSQGHFHVLEKNLNAIMPM